MTPITLTAGQQAACDKLVEFCKPGNKSLRLVIEGFAGVGKTTVVKAGLEAVAANENLKRSILESAGKRVPVPTTFGLTATTNKAAEALADATKMRTQTVHRAFGIRLKSRWIKGQKIETLTDVTQTPDWDITIIDEASFIDEELLQILEGDAWLASHKVIFIGDPAQLSPVKSTSTPVFDQGWETIRLTEVVRQDAGNQIIDISTAFRNAVNGDSFEPFVPDNSKVIHLPLDQFEGEIIQEYARDDYHEKDAKVLAWTNKRVNHYNEAIKRIVSGCHKLGPGDDAACNTYFKAANGKAQVKTDATVKILDTTPMVFEYKAYGIAAHRLRISNNQNETLRCWTPDSRADLEALQRDLARDQDDNGLELLEGSFIDLRPLYACTVNKSQGSTYRKVFIDLSDIGRCREKQQMQRMLYVAFSRASDQVILTGDVA